MEPVRVFDEGRTIIEAKVNGQWKRIAACSPPVFAGDIMLIERVVMTRRPEFTIQPIGTEAWLKKKLLLVTTIKENEKSQSTTSWACTYIEAHGVAEFEHICALTNVSLQL